MGKTGLITETPGIEKAKTIKEIALPDMPTPTGIETELKNSSKSNRKHPKRITANGSTKYDCKNELDASEVSKEINKAMESASFHYGVAIGVSVCFSGLMVLISYLAFNWS